MIKLVRTLTIGILVLIPVFSFAQELIVSNTIDTEKILLDYPSKGKEKAISICLPEGYFSKVDLEYASSSEDLKNDEQRLRDCIYSYVGLNALEDEK